MARSYEERKAEEAARNRRQSRAGRDIGPPPEVADAARKAEAQGSLRRFAEIYFPHLFRLAWSDDHLKVVGRLEAAARVGGRFALAMPRGSGKTTLTEVACLWAVLTGLRRFLLVVGASRPHALESMSSLQAELETNDLLNEDWPEVCFPIRALEGISNRCAGQLVAGERTHVSWRRDELVLPTIAGSAASGAIIRTAGITGRLRGMKFTTAAGQSLRPDLVVIDDPQTDRSARSLTQCEQRARILGGAILGLAGPGQQIAAVCPCTVIRVGDVADVLLDRDRNPEWQGERLKLLYKFPDRLELWEEYGEHRANELRNGGDGSGATAFYRAHREEMDQGAEVAWPARFLPSQLSALQFAMDLCLGDKERFLAEFQNTPQAEDAGEHQLEPAAVAGRVNGLLRGQLPREAGRITVYVDVQGKLLYWLAAAWSDSFTGWIVDYGSYPDQKRVYFTLADATRTLARAAPGTGLEASIHAGLTRLADDLLGREWPREDGAVLKVDKLLIDANWGRSTDVVYAWCRQSPHAAIVAPAHGRFVGPASKPWHEYVAKPGERLGLHWIVAAPTKRAIRHVLIDVNWWKTFAADRLLAAIGERGALTLFGRPGDQAAHRLLADHFCAEYRVRTEGRGRAVDVWSARPGKPDNHWWDCLVGSAAAASIAGCVLAGASEPHSPRKRVSFREQYEAKHKGKEAA